MQHAGPLSDSIAPNNQNIQLMFNSAPKVVYPKKLHLFFFFNLFGAFPHLMQSSQAVSVPTVKSDTVKTVPVMHE